MNKFQLTVILTSMTIINFSCSSNNDDNGALNEAGKLLKSKVYLNPPSDAPNYDEYYQYQDGLLTSASGSTHLVGEYTYSDGKLISFDVDYFHYSYEYDEDGRLKKQIEPGGYYKELFYETNKIAIRRYDESSPNNNVVAEIELLLDNEGRIIKMTDLTEDRTIVDKEYEIYEYDANGNIKKKTTKFPFNPQEVASTYAYEPIKNPYYYSFKKYYESTYYLENFKGLSIYNEYGLTPNLIKSPTSTFETDKDDSLILEHKGDIEIAYEYFE